jgi:hypothetical protein
MVYENAKMLSMAKQNNVSINHLQRLLPEGCLVEAAWLTARGYSTSLRSQYVAAGWLKQPARRVYVRGSAPLKWQQAVISMQTLLQKDLIVGGRTALELHGFTHYLARETKRVHLYGPKRPPSWLFQLPTRVQFVYHNDGRVFRSAAEARIADPLPSGLAFQEWGERGSRLVLSSPERALLELLDELPNRESFHQVDKLVEGLANLSPRKMEKLLLDSHNIKVKRLFFFFADRHRHAWLRRIGRAKIDLGKGKRMLVRGGRLNTAYLITVPRDLDADR